MAISITKPTVGSSVGTWGTELNTALDTIVTGVNDALAQAGGGSSGIPASTVTAKGDLLVATGSGTVVRQGIGTNGYTPVADSTANTGIAWRLPSGSPVLMVRQTSFQTFASTEEKGVTFHSAAYDRFSVFTSGNSTYTPGVAGYYEVTGGVTFAQNGTNDRLCYWVTGGNPLLNSGTVVRAASTLATSVVAKPFTVYLAAGAGIALYAYQNSTADLNTYISGYHGSYMQVKWLGA